MAFDNEVAEMDNSENSPSKQQKPTDISEAIESIIFHIGEMGTYQRFLFLAMLPFGFCWAFVYFGQMFLTATPQVHWCLVPELQGLSVEIRRNLSIPITNGDYDRCRMYDADWSAVLETMVPPDPSTPTVSCRERDGWEFLYDDIPYKTIVSEREWVCDRAWLEPVAQSLNFVGSIVGGVLCGILADMFGRVPVLILANLLGCLGGVATIFTTGFWDFTICRFIVGMSCDSLYLMLYIITMEYVGISHRTWVANFSIAIYFGGGCLVLPWLALWISDWRTLSLAISLPMLLVLLTPLLVPESARWLVSKGKIDRAVAVIRRFERINKRKVPSEVMDDFLQTAKSHKEEKSNAIDLFKTPSLRIIMFYLVVMFMSVAVVFDGLVRLSETLGLDFFVTFAVTSATEIPSIAVLVLLMDRFGRRKLVFASSVLAGSIAFIGAFVPRGVASVTLAVAARFLINMSYCAVIQWSPELLPTGVRASGASFVHMSAFAALVLSPFIVFSENAWESLPLILVGIIGVIGGGVALLLPETAGKPMPQTMEDWEKLASTRPYKRKRKHVTSQTNRNAAEENS